MRGAVAGPALAALGLATLLAASALGVASPAPRGEPQGELTGGATTVYANGRNAFSLPAANLADDEHTRFVVGNSFFRRNWVEAPASTTARDGLGPHFIARSCGGCHVQDGRGAPPELRRRLGPSGADDAAPLSDAAVRAATLAPQSDAALRAAASAPLPDAAVRAATPAQLPDAAVHTVAADPTHGAHGAHDAHEQPVALLLRLSVPGTGPHGGPRPEPVYGEALNNAAVTGVRPEGRVTLHYTGVHGHFADGTPYTLQRPHYGVADLAYGPLAAGTMIGPRIAPQLIGVGLLEAIADEDILANAREQAAAGGPVSGRPNRVWDAFAGEERLGRFGWKANVATLAHQTAAAFVGDIGITSSRFPEEGCSTVQADCLAAPRGASAAVGGAIAGAGRAAVHGAAARAGVSGGAGSTATRDRGAAARTAAKDGASPGASSGRTAEAGAAASEVEIDDKTLGDVVFYQATLAPPARRTPNDPQVRRGERLFAQAQCAACHRPSYVTSAAPFPPLSSPALEGQRIWPYTDLLLHDMGEGLADGRPDFAAGGREWRTPPLWGLGLVRGVNGHERLLHDGRARGVLEAILWHGGEAGASRGQVLKMSRAEREALVKFVESL